jgi:uncharacterized membrane protein HdeD (DUF308 family)
VQSQSNDVIATVIKNKITMGFEKGDRQKKSMNNARGIMGLSMGVVYCIFGSFLIYFKSLGQFEQVDKTVVYALAGLMIAYGIFRVYRGFKMMRSED